MTDIEYIDEEAPPFRNSPLLKPISSELAQPEPRSDYPTPPPPIDHTNPGPSVRALFPGRTLDRHNSDASSEDVADDKPAMLAQVSSPQKPMTECLPRVADASLQLPAIVESIAGEAIPPTAEQKAAVLAAAVLQESDKGKSLREDSTPVSRNSVLQESVSQTALKIETSLPISSSRPPFQYEKTLAESPVGKHVINCEEDRLPVVSPSSANTAASPKSQQLPPIHHLTSQLSDLAEIASQQDPRTQAQPAPIHQHTHPLSAAAQSPYFQSPFPTNGQSSPGNFAFGRSPSSTASDPSQSFPRFAHPRDRSGSVATDIGRTFPPGLHSMRSASSSGESGQTGSSAESYSTNHTTPIETQPPPPENSNRVLPLPNGMPGAYQCEHDGCNATFSTQYLLSSHKNVHSQVRTHFCPHEGCSRGEGGKGFKRKNEMIRHGLVHESPGYVCPYCTDIPRKYPRPDNLQRHVRVHHVDKDKDDPALREVLAQRTEGATRGNRRRRTTTGSANGGQQ